MESLPVTDDDDGGQSRNRRNAADATSPAHRRNQLNLSLACHPYDSSRMFHPLVLCFFCLTPAQDVVVILLSLLSLCASS